MSIDDVRDVLTQRNLIDQLTSKSSNSSDDLFDRGRSNDVASTSHGGNDGKNRECSKSKNPNSNRHKTWNYCHLKAHIKSKCYKLNKQSGG